MILINLLYIHILFCKNLQLIIRWWLRVTLRPRGSCTSGIQISIGFWRGVLPLLTSWTFYGILILVLSLAGWCTSVYCGCLDRAIIFYNRSVTEASSTSITLVSMWCTSVYSSTTIIAQLRYFVRGDITRWGRVSPILGKMMWTSPVGSVFLCLSLFWIIVFFYVVFSTTLVIL